MPPSVESLLADLRRYASGSDGLGPVDRFLALLDGPADPFSRFHRDHVTASTIIAGPGTDEILLRYHLKLERWLQPGGHVEPEDASVFEAALREAREETGIAEFVAPAGERILDVDVHDIPPRSGAPAHRHYDLRFLLLAPAGSRASARHRTRWFPAEKILRESETSLSRAVARARDWLASSGA